MTKWERRDAKRTPKMRVNGASVKVLARLVPKKVRRR